MKTALLSGSAALALAFTAGTAAAQARFDVLIGGDAWFQGGFVDDEVTGENLRSVEFQNRFRLNIIPSAKADNGLEYGGRLRIRAVANGGIDNNVDADRAYIFAQGSFGQIRLGTQAGASDEWAVIGPVTDWGTQGGPDGWWSSFVADAASLPAQHRDGELRTFGSSAGNTRVAYLSPSFSGFSLAASFQPVSSDAATSIDRSKTTGEFSNTYEIGALYSGEFGGVTVEGNVFYSGGETERGGGATALEDLQSVFVGAQVGYAGFKVGGFYSWAGDSGYAKTAVSKEDIYTWTLAGQYQIDAFTLGVAYSYGQDAGSNAVRGKTELDLWQAGVTYLVAPGLTLGLEYTHYDNEVKDRSAASRDGDLVIVETRLTF